LGGLGDFSSFIGFGDGLDDTDSDSLSHITYGEASKWWVFSECLNAHWASWLKCYDSGISGFDEDWVLFKNLSRTFVDLLLDLLEFACNMSSVAIEYWGVLVADLTWMVEDNDLSFEGFGFLGWVFFAVGSNMSTTDILDGDVLDIESNVVTWNSLFEGFVMHLDGFDFGGDTVWCESGDTSWLEHTSLDTSYWDCSNTADLVDVLEWETEWLGNWSLWCADGIKSLIESLSGVPSHVGALLKHVITMESRDWDEEDLSWVVADLLEVLSDLSDNFVVALLAVVWLS
jgi:hypothetical protein